MYVCYTDFNLEDWEIIISTVHCMYKDFFVVYSINENPKTNGLPAVIEFY